jgi:hypothetical protein
VDAFLHSFTKVSLSEHEKLLVQTQSTTKVLEAVEPESNSNKNVASESETGLPEEQDVDTGFAGQEVEQGKEKEMEGTSPTVTADSEPPLLPTPERESPVKPREVSPCEDVAEELGGYY